MNDFLNIVKKIIYYPSFIKDYINFKNKSKIIETRFDLKWTDRYPCLNDKTSNTPFDRHYVLHTAWAMRKVAENKPKKHIDISSYIYFPTLLSAFIPTEFYDFRPVSIELSNLKTGKADLNKLPFGDSEISSLSCMHTVEHIGLGRYGDKIDPDGDIKAINELKRVLAHDGILLFVVPVGKPAIKFNAHRIYSYNQITDYFKGLELKEFSLIPEKKTTKDIILHASPEDVEKETYGCGCFLFKKN